MHKYGICTCTCVCIRACIHTFGAANMKDLSETFNNALSRIFLFCFQSNNGDSRYLAAVHLHLHTHMPT